MPLGYDTKTEITRHGSRAMAHTILHQELGVKPEVIEHQLARRVHDAPARRGARTGDARLRHTARSGAGVLNAIS